LPRPRGGLRRRSVNSLRGSADSTGGGSFSRFLNEKGGKKVSWESRD